MKTKLGLSLPAPQRERDPGKRPWERGWIGDRIIKQLLNSVIAKISWFVSVSQVDYLPQSSASANNWSARHRKITIFCSPSPINIRCHTRKHALIITFTLCSRYKGIDNNLRSIKEISKLRFPNDKVIRVLNTHAIFKSKTSFFWQRTVYNLWEISRRKINLV